MFRTVLASTMLTSVLSFTSLARAQNPEQLYPQTCRYVIQMPGAPKTGGSITLTFASYGPVATLMTDGQPTFITRRVDAKLAHKISPKERAHLAEQFRIAGVDPAHVITLDQFAVEPTNDGAAATLTIFRNDKGLRIGALGSVGWLPFVCLK